MIIKYCKTCVKEIRTFPCLKNRKNYCSKVCAGKSKKGNNNPFFGKKHTLETKLHLSITRLGKYTKEGHHNWKGGKPNCIDCKKKLSSYYAKRCNPCNGKLHGGKNSIFFGKHPTEEVRKKMSERMKNLHPKGLKWIDGRSSIKGYNRFYKRQYVYRKKGATGSHTKQEWEDLKEHYLFMCVCCKRNDVEITEDHIIPLSKGGSNFIENIQPLCRSCNGRKINKTIDYRQSFLIN